MVSPRYKRSQLEAKTLEAVKKELGKLDCQVSRDVSILRDRIEEASRQYTLARFVHILVHMCIVHKSLARSKGTT